MPPSNILPTTADILLPDLGGTLSGASLRDLALAAEDARSPAAEALLTRHHGFTVDGLATTPFMHQASVAAREAGFFSMNRLERDFLPYAPAWRHPELSIDFTSVKRGPERIIAPALWPFAQDCPVADFQVNLAPKWWSHGLVHALVGFAWWPGFDEWALMHTSRLSEAVAALHWYWLAELGRMHPHGADIDLSELRGDEGARYAQLEFDARDPAVRRERLMLPLSEHIGDNGLETLNYETFCYRQAMAEGVLVEPTDRYLGFGEACEYARVHIGRVRSASFSRWLEHCALPGLDYATTPEAFERRAAVALRAVLTPAAPSPDARARRAVRVLQDLGQRVCHAAELLGRPSDGFAPAIAAIADGLARLRGHDGAEASSQAANDAADDVVAGALEAVIAGFRGAPAPIRVDQVLALGYRPTDDPEREPLISAAIRGEAAIARAWAVGAPLGTAFEAMRPAVRRVIQGPRGSDLLAELRAGAEAAAAAEALSHLGEAYVGWLQYAQTLWSRFDGADPAAERRWRYRLARTRLPADPATFSRFVIERNPYLTRLPLPFDAAWNEAFVLAPRGEVAPFEPRPGTGINYVLAGPGRERPVYAPVSPRLSGLLIKLKAPKRLDALLAMREVDERALAEAVERELVLCFEKPFFEMAEETDDPFEMMLRAAEEEPVVDEPVGAWQEERMAAAYEAFCARSTLYHDVSRALVAALDPAPDARVAELGVGTGVTSRAVLERLGQGGRLVGVDPAPRMAGRARELTPDERAHFIVGAGRALAAAAAREGAFDGAVASSSLWLSRSVTGELEALRRALREGGRLAFSIPAEYVGDTAHLGTAEARAVAAALEAARVTTGIGPPAPGDAHFGEDPALRSTEALRAALASAGYDGVEITPYRRPWPAAEYLDWLAMPAVIEGMVSEADRGRAGELVAATRAAIPPETPLATVWYLVTATAR